ncbi:MAG: glycosyltransferase family 4 protein [Candidatus Woesearchaeota archaeon]
MFGGEERYIHDHATFLKSLRYNVKVLQRRFRDYESRDGKNVGHPDIPVKFVSFAAPRNVNSSIVDRQFFYNFIATPYLLRFAGAQDVVIVHYPRLFFPGALASKLFRGTRVICLSHGVVWDIPDMSIQESVFFTWVKFLDWWGLRFADIIVANDSSYAREAAMLCPGVEKRTVVIPNYVDADFFTPSRQSPDEIILCPRNLQRARGIDIAVRAMSIVGKHYPKATLLIIGDGPQRQEIELLIKETRARAVLKGKATKKEMLNYYHKSKIVVVPSRFSEGTSLAVLEACACGIPVIATKVGGLPDIIQHGINGLLVDPSPESLASGIISLLSDEKLRIRLSRAGRVAAETKFSRRKWEERWLKVLHSLPRR